MADTTEIALPTSIDQLTPEQIADPRNTAMIEAMLAVELAELCGGEGIAFGVAPNGDIEEMLVLETENGSLTQVTQYGPGIWEMQMIQREFMLHFDAKTPEELIVPDGNYIAYVFDEPFHVTVRDNQVRILRDDEEFDSENATQVNPGESSALSQRGGA